MRLRTATLATAAVFVAGLSLTACNSGNDDAKAKDGSSPSATASSTSKGSTGSGTGGTSTGKPGGAKASATAAGKGTGSGGGAVGACTTKTTTVQFIASASHASESEPAAATVKVTNTSGSTCTLVGASTLTAKDDQGKAAPIETDNSAAGTDAVYTDLNFEGSQSAREVCAVQASKVEIALPKDIARTVKVTKANGSAGVFNVCTKDVKFGSFHS
jgi:hypothetical protein